MGDEQRELNERPNWLQQQLRVQLLPHNPQFQQQVIDVRQALGIPENGLPDDGTADDWFERHLQEHDPASLLLIELWGPIPGRTWVDRLARAMPQDAQPTLLERTYLLLDDFNLPPTIFGHLLWLVMTGEPIPEQAVSTTFVEIVEPPDLPPDASPDRVMVQNAIYDRFHHGLPDVPGDLVVIKMVVNEYTTRRELEDTWAFVEEVRRGHLQGRRIPNRRRAGPGVEGQLDRWLAWFNARREGATLWAIADEWDVAEETIRNALNQLNQLMEPNNRGS